jgi:hypothetical protein
MLSFLKLADMVESKANISKNNDINLLNFTRPIACLYDLLINLINKNHVWKAPFRIGSQRSSNEKTYWR